MNVPDDSLWWRLLLIANTLTAWLAWQFVPAKSYQSLAAAKARPRGRWLVIAAWLAVVLAISFQCGWKWGSLSAMLSLLFGVVVWLALKQVI